MLRQLNDKHRAVSAIRELVLDRVLESNHPNADTPVKCSASQFLTQYCQIKNPTNAQAKEAAQALREFYGEPVRSGGVSRWQVYTPYISLGEYERLNSPPSSDGHFQDVPF